MKQHKQLGDKGEQFVCNYLHSNGFKILLRNYRKQYGEIDIIAQNKNTIAFVEVKTRSYHLIHPAEIITSIKQRKIIAVAKQFIAKHNYTDTMYRFDVAFIEHKNNTMHLDYIENAFIDESDY